MITLNKMPMIEFLVPATKLVSRFSNLLLCIAIFMLISMCTYMNVSNGTYMAFHFKYATDGFQ